jgi:phosphoribosylanthranilate isomerase
MINNTKVKFCGMTQYDDIKEAIDLGVDFIGMIIDVHKSRRSMKKGKAIKLAKKVHDKHSNTKLVAVVVDPSLELVEELSQNFDIIQIHGEFPTGIEKIESEIWKAYSTNDQNLEDLKENIKKDNKKIHKILLDAANYEDKVNEEKYVSFHAFDLYNELDQEYDLVLAGGINSENIEFFVQKLKPKIIDLSSSIEISPGQKDHKKMKDFILHLKSALNEE